MDITSFSLGISFTLVVGMLAVTVYNLLRVYTINKEIQGIHETTNANYENVWSEFARINSNLDSRIDKLIYRLDRLERESLGKSNKKQILND